MDWDHTLTPRRPGVGDEPAAHTARQAISSLMLSMERHSAVGEARFAALETALRLIQPGIETPEDPGERVELLREALGCARATVVAAGYALSRSSDSLRNLRAEGLAEGR